VDIGLYPLKYPFRKLIAFLVPRFKNANPNVISVALFPIGVAMALCYFLAIRDDQHILLIVAIVLGFLRMVVSTLDGIVAQEYDKSSKVGDIINRLHPEICDLMLYPTIIFAMAEFSVVHIAALAMSWAITFFGLLGAASGCAVQSVGPAGQTDRLAALMLFTLFEFLSIRLGWGLSFFNYFFYWVLIGGCLTLYLRYTRSIKQAKELDLA
jgi:CDP-diacylglycerol--glycerol-3-phosphate 3-phosphatidyltransferase